MTLHNQATSMAAAMIMVAAPAFADPTNGKGGPSPEITFDLGTSIINKMSSIYSTDNFTCTTTFTTMLQKTFFQTARGDISIMFQAENFPGCRVLVRVLRNGVVLPGPGDAGAPMAIHDTTSELSTNGFNFLDNNRPAGNYTYQVQCQCDTGSTVVDERSLTILHR